MLYKETLKNKLGLDLVVLVEWENKPKGLVFIEHGLSGTKEHPHIEMTAMVFKKYGYTTVRFDTTNSFGESGGKYEDATITSSYNDLESAIEWAKTQIWYQEPFILAGYSMGGISVALYASAHPEKIKALAPLSTAISGRLSLESPAHKNTWNMWKETGWYEIQSVSRKGLVKRLPWSHVEDKLTYDLLPKANTFTMPVLMLAGELDESTPPEHQKLLFDLLPGEKEFHIIKGAPHTFTTEAQLLELSNILDQWLQKIELSDKQGKENS